MTSDNQVVDVEQWGTFELELHGTASGNPCLHVELAEETLATLSQAPLNKLRMCVFPKSYDFNHNEPEFYPFPPLSRGSSTPEVDGHAQSTAGWSFDTSRFAPEFFRHLERRVLD